MLYKLKNYNTELDKNERVIININTMYLPTNN